MSIRIRNRLLHKASEFLTRPKTHPTKAILEAIQYAGFKLPAKYNFEEMKADAEKQFAEAFPNLLK